MINDIINNIEAILIGDSPAVKAYLGDTVIWEAPNDNEYTNRTYRHQYFTTEALADNCVITLNIAQNVSTSIVTGFYYSRDRITWTPILNVAGETQAVSLPAINTGEKYYWKGTNYAISQNGSYNETSENVDTGFTPVYKNVHISSSQNFKVYGNMFSLLWGDNFIGKNYFPDDTTNYIYAGFFWNCTTLIDAQNLYFPGQHTKGFNYSNTETPVSDEVINCFNDLFNGCSNLNYGPVIEMLTINGNSSIKCMFQGCENLKSTTFYAIIAPTGKDVSKDYINGVTYSDLTVYLPTISTWDGAAINSSSQTPGTVSKTIDLSTIDFS